MGGQKRRKTMNTMLTRDKIQGMFLGIAIGDALFMPVETMRADAIAKRYGRITTYLRPDGHKWFNGREAGTWTDDTQLTLAVAESLIASQGINMDDMAARHITSMRKEGDLGFGGGTREAIRRLARGVHWSRSGIPENPKHGFGNGIPMKIAPIAVYCISPYTERNKKQIEKNLLGKIFDFIRMTHYTTMAVDSAFAHIMAIIYCLMLDKPEDFRRWAFVGSIKSMIDPRAKDDLTDHLAKCFAILKNMRWNTVSTNDLINFFGGGTSYVYNSLPFSYAFFLKNPYSIETLYDVGNAGGDTDTNASIVGGLLGALNGTIIFPQHLRDGLWQKERIINTAERFCDTFEIRE
jgi:ADP-ribosylglycohydrolase